MSGSPIPRQRIEGATTAHRRLEESLKGLTDEMVRQPTPLPGWTVGHLLTHVARNADGLAGIVEAAQRGEVGVQYPGGAEQRNGDIEAGHARPAAELIADVRQANRRLEDAWQSTDEETWATAIGQRAAGPMSVADFVFLRWREVEVHRADLGFGGGWETLDPAYVDGEWPTILAHLDARVPDDVTVILVPGDRPTSAFGRGERHVVVRDAPPLLLKWLFGRGGDSSWPELRPWSTI